MFENGVVYYSNAVLYVGTTSRRSQFRLRGLLDVKRKTPFFSVPVAVLHSLTNLHAIY